jgi:hypothetical protein
VAKLADAPDLGSGSRKGVKVQVLSSAPEENKRVTRNQPVPDFVLNDVQQKGPPSDIQVEKLGALYFRKPVTYADCLKIGASIKLLLEDLP